MASQPDKRKSLRSKKPTANKRWVARVKTVSTFPPRDTFNQDAETVARVMASKKVSPKGIGSGIRMIQYFINRAGKNLAASRKRELEKAKRILQERARSEGSKSSSDRNTKSRSR
jgi:Protein of unknown function (DUF3175)